MVTPDRNETGAATGPAGAFRDLAGLLASSLEALAKAGQADAACRLAGQACAVLRKDDPGGWRKFNTLLHRIAKLTAHPERENRT